MVCVGLCLIGLLIVVTTPGSGHGRLTALLVTALPFLAMVYRFGRMGIAVGAGDILVRNVFRSVRSPRGDVVSVGMAGRWYLGMGHLAEVRLEGGRRVASIGLSGASKRVEAQVTGLATVLGVPRIDHRGGMDVEKPRA